MKEKFNILIVDDEIHVITALKRILLYEKFNVDYAIKPSDALEMLHLKKYDLIISDQRMPDMSGIEVLEYASRISPHTIRVLLTAYADLTVLENAINRSKIHYYFQKPWDSTNLVETLKRVLKDNSKFTSDENKRLDVITVKKDNSMIFIKPAEIYYLVATEGKVTIITKDDRYFSWDSLKVWEEKLRRYGFFRCHRGYLVNVDKIKSITPWFKDTYNLKLKDIPEEIYTSKSYINSLKSYFSIFN